MATKIRPYTDSKRTTNYIIQNLMEADDQFNINRIGNITSSNKCNRGIFCLEAVVWGRVDSLR